MNYNYGSDPYFEILMNNEFNDDELKDFICWYNLYFSINDE